MAESQSQTAGAHKGRRQHRCCGTGRARTQPRFPQRPCCRPFPGLYLLSPVPAPAEAPSGGQQAAASACVRLSMHSLSWPESEPLLAATDFLDTRHLGTQTGIPLLQQHSACQLHATCLTVQGSNLQTGAHQNSCVRDSFQRNRLIYPYF